jgi:hypothetical protein
VKASLLPPALLSGMIGSGSWWSPKNKETREMKIERTFDMEKETKNTIRYSEVAEGQPPIIGTIYIQKWAMKGVPKRITVTLDIAEEESK